MEYSTHSADWSDLATRPRESSSTPFFVMLLLIACITTAVAYHYFARTRALQDELAQLATHYETLQEQSQEQTATLAYVKEQLGYPTDLSSESLRNLIREDLGQYHAAPVDSNFRSLLAYLTDQHRQRQEEATSSQRTSIKLESQLENLEPAYQAQLEVHRQDRDRVVREMAELRNHHAAQLTELQEQINQLVVRLEEKGIQVRNLERNLEEERGTSQRKIQSLVGTIRELRAEDLRRHADRPQNGKPDGQIVYVDSASRTATVSLGEKDGVQPGMVFQVFQRVAGESLGKEIGKLEVVSVENSRCQAQIRQSQMLDPLVPGDYVFCPTLSSSRGKQEYFALAGPVDINNDRQDDTELLKRLIEQQGGKLIFHLDQMGNRTGFLSLKTKYLIVHDRPRDYSPDVLAQMPKNQRELLKQLAAVYKEATEAGIPVIDATRFADMIGYRKPHKQ